MGLPLNTVEYYDNSGGLNRKVSPTKGSSDQASLSLNVSYTVDGAFGTRFGSSILNVSGSPAIPAQISGAPRGLGLYDYMDSNGDQIQVFCAGTSIYHSLTTPVAQVTGLTSNLIPDFEFLADQNKDYLFFGNGTDTNRVFDGTSWTNWSLPQPSSPSGADNGVGVIGAGTYYYYYSYAVVEAGIIIREGELSPVSTGVTIAANRQIQVTVANSADTQVNAKVIYRRLGTGVVYRLTEGATINDNTTTTYNDNNTDPSTIEAEFDNQAAPTTSVFEANDFGEMFIVDAAKATNIYVSKPYRPWNVPEDAIMLLDGPCNGIKRVYGAILFSTTSGSLWVMDGPYYDNNLPRRISSKIGALNNRCMVGEDTLYILATNLKFYPIHPTDFSQTEMRLQDGLSFDIDPVLQQISRNSLNHVCMEYYTTADQVKVHIKCPIETSTNNFSILYNEGQSIAKEKPVWETGDNQFISAIKQFTINGEQVLVGLDYNGFVWKLEDSSIYGDGAEYNGTVTSAGATTLTDSTQTWVVNELVGKTVSIIDGTGVDQVRTIVSNTSTEITVSSAWNTIPDITSIFTVGGYNTYHYTNWLSVSNSFDTLKQLWYIYSNLNASGDYFIKLIIQTDFNQTISDQTNLNINLQSANTIWGSFIWGEAIWGARSVFQDRLAQYLRFRSIRFGFQNWKAGQPFQVNGFTVAFQDKKLFYKAAA